MMDLDLIYKIVCKKGIKITIEPTELPDYSLIKLKKGGRKRGILVAFHFLRLHTNPEDALKEDLLEAVESLEKGETDDGSV